MCSSIPSSFLKHLIFHASMEANKETPNETWNQLIREYTTSIANFHQLTDRKTTSSLLGRVQQNERKIEEFVKNHPSFKGEWISIKYPKSNL